MRLKYRVVALWGEEDRQPAVGDFGGQLDVLGPDGRQVDGDGGIGLQGTLQRLAQAGRVVAAIGDLIVVALEGQRGLAAEDGADDADVFARAPQRLGVADAVPPLDHLRPGETQAHQEASAGELVERHGGHGGVGRGSAGHLHDGRAQLNACRQRPQPGQRRDGVGAIGLGRPDAVDAQPVGLLDEFDGELHLAGGVTEHET